MKNTKYFLVVINKNDFHKPPCFLTKVQMLMNKKLGYRRETDASSQLKSCQLPRNSAETTYTTSPNQIDGMKLEI